MHYQEGGARSWVRLGWILLAVALAVLAVGVVLSSFPLGFVGVVGVVLAGIALLTAWSVGRYGAIVVTDDTLRIGRSSVPLSSLTSLVSPSQLPPDVVARAQNPLPVRGVGGTLFGGSFGLQVAQEPVGFTTSDHPEMRIFGTRNANELVQVLATHLARPS